MTRFWGGWVRLGQHLRGQVKASDDPAGALRGAGADGEAGEKSANRPRVDACAGALDDQAASRDVMLRHRIWLPVAPSKGKGSVVIMYQ